MHSDRNVIKADREGLVTLSEVGRVTRLSESTIRRRIKEGQFPAFLQGLTRCKFKLTDIETYLTWRAPQPWSQWNPPL